jgi:hypothetical protein
LGVAIKFDLVEEVVDDTTANGCIGESLRGIRLPGLGAAEIVLIESVRNDRV